MAAIIIYPIGLIALNLYLLVHARKAIVGKRQTMLSLATAFLHKEYKPSFFFWEIIEMFRRFWLVGVMVVIENGKMLQLILGAVFATILLFLQLLTAPYIATSDNFLAGVSSFALLIVFLCSIGFKDAALTDLSDIREKMSREQKETYTLDTRLLTVIIFLAVIASLVVATVIFFFQLAAERARKRSEARASSARRLRYVSDDREAELGQPIIPDKAAPSFAPTYQMGAVSGRFHIFLSHVWGTGQVVPTHLSTSSNASFLTLARTPPRLAP